MNSPLHQGRISAMSNATLDRSMNLPDNSGWSEKVYKTKPSYVAKKITKEELFGESLHLKPTTSELVQIQEKFDETEDASNSLNSLNERIERSEREHKNIFKTDKLASSKYKEHHKGPNYSPDGKIIKHSIVGTSENFERHQRNNKRHITLRESLLFLNDNASYSDKSPVRILRHLGSMSDATTPSFSRMASHSNLLVKKNVMSSDQKKHHTKDAKDVKVSSEVLYRKVDEWRRRQKSCSELEQKVNKRLSLEAQIVQTQERRVLEKFDKVVEDWNNTIENMNKRADRRVGKSVMLRGEDHRKKREMAEAINLAQTDQERLGKAYWKMSLRNNGIPDAKSDQTAPILLTTATAFNMTPQKMPSTLEIIRRSSKLSISRSTTTLPSLMDFRSPTQPTPTRPSSREFRYLDRTKNDYLSAKTLLLESNMSKIRPPSTDIAEFIVEGRNKLDMEVNAFFQNAPSNNHYIVPKQIFEKPVEHKDEESFL